MKSYSFVTRWHLAAPVALVWDAIVDVESWPRWWKYVKAVVPLEKGDASGLGAVQRYTWSGPVPYRLSFESRVTLVQTHAVLEAAAAGDLNGTGRWSFSPDGNTTQIRYDWNVSTSKRWMNLLAPMLEPMFRWNHDWIMTEGGRGLARHLGVELLADSESPLE